MVGLIMIVALSASAEVAPPPDVVIRESDASKSHRWVLRFKVKDAEDYVEQLKASQGDRCFPLQREGENANDS